MLNHYLQERAYKGTSVTEVENSFREISKIIGDSYPEEFFCMNNNFMLARISKRNTLSNLLYGEKSQFDKDLLYRVVPSVLAHFNTSYGPYLTIEDFKNAVHIGKKHYFLGARFKNKLDHEIETHAEYLIKRTEYLRNSLTGRNYATILPKLISKVKLTAAGYEMLTTVTCFNNVCNDLITLDKYATTIWDSGAFSIDAVREMGIDISDESKSVHENPKLKAHRLFHISETIGSRYCFLHLKIGTIRVYIYPDINERTIYVPYIGVHLPTQLF